VKYICVFCGSSPGGRPEYAAAAQDLARALVRRELGLVYGGGHVGLMGILARAVLEEGGRVIGVIPRGLVDRELAFTGLADLRVVGTMHERKALMAELAEGFVALPGGLGTIEEFFEALTWGQLGMHHKPCGLLDVGGYYSRLMSFLDHTVDEGFVRPEHRAMVLLNQDPEALLEGLAAYHPPQIDKARWILEASRALSPARDQ
jgi:uncharacterized protein (TIGR00730 family)